jgi:hypothetical protein
MRMMGVSRNYGNDFFCDISFLSLRDQKFTNSLSLSTVSKFYFLLLQDNLWKIHRFFWSPKIEGIEGKLHKEIFQGKLHNQWTLPEG